MVLLSLRNSVIFGALSVTVILLSCGGSWVADYDPPGGDPPGGATITTAALVLI